MQAGTPHLYLRHMYSYNDDAFRDFAWLRINAARSCGYYLRIQCDHGLEAT